MTKYFVYHCSITEIDVEANTLTSILEAHTEDSKIHLNKDDAVTELRDILDKHCVVSLNAENQRLIRVTTVLDRNLADALTVPV